jgi:uncharacterized protein YjbJ (UPF0337 family)
VREDHLHEGRQPMDKDRVKGTINQIARYAKRQAGEWTGDTDTEIEGRKKEKHRKFLTNVKDSSGSKQ